MSRERTICHATIDRNDINRGVCSNQSSRRPRQADIAVCTNVDPRGCIECVEDIQTPASLCLGHQATSGLPVEGKHSLRACTDRCSRTSCPAQIANTGATSCGLGAPCTHPGKAEGARTSAINSQIGISLRTDLKNTARTDLRSDPPAGLPLRRDQLLGASLR
jgi:hypothetical protein